MSLAVPLTLCENPQISRIAEREFFFQRTYSNNPGPSELSRAQRFICDRMQALLALFHKERFGPTVKSPRTASCPSYAVNDCEIRGNVLSFVPKNVINTLHGI